MSATAALTLLGGSTEHDRCGSRKALGSVAAGESVAIVREVFGSPLTDPDSGR